MKKKPETDRKRFDITQRADMATDVRDFVELISWVKQLERRIRRLERT